MSRNWSDDDIRVARNAQQSNANLPAEMKKYVFRTSDGRLYTVYGRSLEDAKAQFRAQRKRNG